jgi:hypothetical protein
MVTRFTHDDEPVAKLKAHSLEGNRPASEALSRRSDGNIAARRGGLSHYQHRASHHSAQHDERGASSYITRGPTKHR